MPLKVDSQTNKQPKPGPLNLITDITGLTVGNAENQQIKSGVTVLSAQSAFRAAVSITGGAPGTRETDCLQSDRLVEYADALVLSGGSAFGLDAASSVMDYLKTLNRGHKVGHTRIPIVPAAILFDLHNGGDKQWLDNPYRGLGQSACQALNTVFSLGSVGAGTGASTATVKGGLGSASIRFPDGHTVGALVAVNPYGSTTLPESGAFWAAPFERDQEFGGRGFELPSERNFEQTKTLQSNTTLAIVATDYALSKSALYRLAVAAHDGIARAIIPAHTLFDGDLVFAISTNTQHKEPDAKTQAWLGHHAALCLARAIARGVFKAQAYPGDIQPTWQSLYGQS